MADLVERKRGAPLTPTEPLATCLAGPATIAARALLGCLISGNGVTVRITEVEAYAGVGEDPGSHAHRGQTRRNTAMFGPPGHAYVYFTYGMHWCLNVVCSPAGRASAVLLRAGEVIAGLDTARARRPRATDRDLARGPARLTTALAVEKVVDGTPLLDSTGPLTLHPGSTIDSHQVGVGPRVGVSGDGAPTPWRFWLDGEPTVSPYRPHTPRNRVGRAAGDARQSPT